MAETQSAEVPNEGLRERKKRELRQLISDTATAMFLEHGFDAVKVADVADVCGVSEKTVFNYFPNKESLILDREDAFTEALREKLGADGGYDSPVRAMLALLADQRRMIASGWEHADDAAEGVRATKRFIELVHETPALRAAQFEMAERLTQVAATVLAERVGVNPQEPEPQVAAHALHGLVNLQFASMARYVGTVDDGDELLELVKTEVERAARVIETGLWSFEAVIGGSTSRNDLETASELTQKTAKQIASALKQARSLWRQVQQESAADTDSPKDTRRAMLKEQRELIEKAKLERRALIEEYKTAKVADALKRRSQKDSH